MSDVIPSKKESLLTRLRDPKYTGQDGLREDAAREIERLNSDLDEAIKLYDGALNMLKPADWARWQTTPVPSGGVYAQAHAMAVTDEWKRGWDACLAAVRTAPETSGEWERQARLTLDKLAGFLQAKNVPYAIDWRDWIDNAIRVLPAYSPEKTSGDGP